MRDYIINKIKKNGGDLMRKNQGKKKTKLQILLYIILLLVVIGTWGFKFLIIGSDKPVSTKENAVVREVIIPDGSSSARIADILKNTGIIRSKFAFKKYLKDNELDRKLRPGQFTLDTSMNYEELSLELTTRGKKKATHIFTIPEGYELEEIADVLEQKGFINRTEFMKLALNPQKYEAEYEFIKYIPNGNSLEGYLYPETYEVYVDANTETILKKMLSQFEKIYQEKLKTSIEEGKDLNELMTMASIVEREAKIDQERPIIASVFYNRLNKNIKFQSCATIQFALKDRKTRLLNKDLEIESPYNTYKYLGIPPGPIASAGLASIEAALNPTKTDYLYFVVNPKGESGSHNFAANYNEFLKYKQIYTESLK